MKNDVTIISLSEGLLLLMRLPYNSLPHTNDNLWRTGEESALAITPCHSRHFCGDEVVWSCHTLILCSTEVNKSHDLPCRKPNSYIFSNQPFIHSPVSLISAYSFPVPTFSITLPSLPAQKCSLLTESIFTVYSQWTESVFFFSWLLTWRRRSEEHTWAL